MGKLTHLMIHCSDTPPMFNVTRGEIEQWHLKERGWHKVGYSMLFLRDGSTDILRPWDADDIVQNWEISNGARGWNGTTRHFCWAGGRAEDGGEEDNRTPGQKYAMKTVIEIMVMLWPDIKLIGHNQVNADKYCPSYDVPRWASDIGIKQKNIDFKTYH